MLSQLVKHGDRIREATFERIDGVDEKKAGIWKGAGVSTECSNFAQPERHHRLHKRVAMSSAGFDSGLHCSTHEAGAGGTSNQSGSRARRRPELRTTPDAEFEGRASASTLSDKTRFGGDQ